MTEHLVETFGQHRSKSRRQRVARQCQQLTNRSQVELAQSRGQLFRNPQRFNRQRSQATIRTRPVSEPGDRPGRSDCVGCGHVSEVALLCQINHKPSTQSGFTVEQMSAAGDVEHQAMCITRRFNSNNRAVPLTQASQRLQFQKIGLGEVTQKRRRLQQSLRFGQRHARTDAVTFRIGRRQNDLSTIS